MTFIYPRHPIKDPWGQKLALLGYVIENISDAVTSAFKKASDNMTYYNRITQRPKTRPSNGLYGVEWPCLMPPKKPTDMDFAGLHKL